MSTTMSMSIIVRWSMRIMSRVAMVIMSTTMSTHFMKLNTIAGIFFFLIKSYIGEIVPNREHRCSYYIREEYLVEHEKYPEWDDDILTTHNEGEKYRRPHRTRIKYRVSKEVKYCPRLEYICLFCHIYHSCKHRYDKKYCRKEIQYRIDSWMCWFCDNKSSMHREEDCKDIYKIYSNTDNKYRKTEWKKSSTRSNRRIT